MAASSLPIPQPPRTPSPLSDDTDHDQRPKGLGLEGGDGPAITTDYDYDIENGISDSPGKEPNSGRSIATASTMLSPTFSPVSASNNALSPHGSLYTPITPQTASTDGGFPQSLDSVAAAGTQTQRNPFNFTTTQYVASGPRSKTSNEALGRRKGHKYRHSSIHASAMGSIIQPPVLRTPLTVPSSLPVPTRKELWRSLTPHQTLRLTWCAAHFLIAGTVQFLGSGSLSMTALSRLLFFDAAGATVSVVVDVMSNFEVWKRSSIKHPFGLERADVLAGFGMAVFIAFMGLDVLSHSTEHSLENLGTHEPHSPHAHSRVPTSNIHLASLLAIGATLVSATLLRSHRRIGSASTVRYVPDWAKLVNGPSHILALSCSTLLLFLPILSNGLAYIIVDIILGLAVAVLMVAVGAKLGSHSACILLMSYKADKNSNHPSSVRDVVAEVQNESGVSAVEEAKFWQVHYNLFIANLKLRYHDSSGGEGMEKVRQRVLSLIRQRLGGKWEGSVQMAVERD